MFRSKGETMPSQESEEKLGLVLKKKIMDGLLEGWKYYSKKAVDKRGDLTSTEKDGQKQRIDLITLSNVPPDTLDKFRETAEIVNREPLVDEAIQRAGLSREEIEAGRKNQYFDLTLKMAVRDWTIETKFF